MLIRNGEKAYKCSEIKKNTVGKTTCLMFTILEPVSSFDLSTIFEDNEFYLYDEVWDCVLAETNNKKLVGLNITYNADSTCDIKIKLTKGDVLNED